MSAHKTRLGSALALAKAAAHLLWRLAVPLLVVSLLTDAVLWLFAPRWLLLDPKTVAACSSLALECMALALLAELLILVALLRPLAGTLHHLEDGSEIEPPFVLSLYALPARLAGAHVGVAGLLALATLVDRIRPVGVDLYTQGALALLALTMVVAASLPLYVMARARIGRAMEPVPPPIAREALALISAPGQDIARVRLRFLAAVAAPVSLVAMGASLLVFAHERSYEAGALRDDARAVAAGTIDLVDGHADGRMDALVHATAMGLHIEVEPAGQPASGADPEGNVTVPLEDGRAIVRLEPTTLSTATATWALIALASVAIAALLGRQVGAVLSRDVAVAKSEIEAMGAADVLRGSRAIGGVRFDAVKALGDAIDRLGGVFAEFAAAQERAIKARASMERTRAMFLASMSHDLRSPLNAILGFATLASQSGDLLPAQRESLAIIEQRGRELLGLIQTVLDSARAEAGQLTLMREMAAPAEVVSAAVREAQAVTSGANVEIVADLGAAMPFVSVDAGRLTQAIVAITTSAARACEKGIVRVGAGVADDVLRIEIVAMGGVDAGADRLAEALQSPERARRLGSLGLGLLVARAIVVLHGGKMDLDRHSEAGPVVRVLLPVGPRPSFGSMS